MSEEQLNTANQNSPPTLKVGDTVECEMNGEGRVVSENNQTIPEFRFAVIFDIYPNKVFAYNEQGEYNDRSIQGLMDVFVTKRMVGEFSKRPE